jgi:hypothetical protein
VKLEGGEMYANYGDLGLYLELPVGWGQIWYLVKREDTRGQSLEIWYVSYSF